MTVTEYRDRFLQLARYAPAEVTDDSDKQEHFMEGLNDHLQYTLLNFRFIDFNHLVDSALNTERKRREIEECKRKLAPAAPNVTAESAVDAPNMVIGMFMVNSYPATVLFDTGSTHSFITKSFIEQHHIPVSCMRAPMVVTTSGGRIHTCSICSRISVLISGVVFRTGLIILDFVGIDVCVVLSGPFIYLHLMVRR